MTASALQTFGIDSTELLAYLPQLGMAGTDDLLSEAVITQLVAAAASRVCGVLTAAGLPAADIAADTASGAYALCRSLVIDLTLPTIQRALGIGSSAEHDAALARALAELKRIEVNPAVLGYDADSDYSPSAWSTTSVHADLADTNPVVYRRWADHDGDGPKW